MPNDTASKRVCSSNFSMTDFSTRMGDDSSELNLGLM
jgi:hypothetical protein